MIFETATLISATLANEAEVQVGESGQDDSVKVLNESMISGIAPMQQVSGSMGGAVDHLPCFKDLIAVLFECFLIISLGYLSRRFKLISNEAKDLNSYLTTFALPMIIFLNIAQMEFQTINMSFLLCMLVAKFLVFILVSIMSLTISYPTNFGYAGSLSILATQSNDFALGYPLIKSLYGDSKPEMLTYLSLMAPIQLLILNPLGIIMLEYHKSRKSKRIPPKPIHEDQNREQQISQCSFCLINPNASDEAETLVTATQNAAIRPTESSNPSHGHHQIANRSLGLRGHHRLSSPVAFQPDVDGLSMSGSSADGTNTNNTFGSAVDNKHPGRDRPASVGGKRGTVSQLAGFRERNVKSLTLTVRQQQQSANRSITIESGSEESINTMNGGEFFTGSTDCKLTYYGFQAHPGDPQATLAKPSNPNDDSSPVLVPGRLTSAQDHMIYKRSMASPKSSPISSVVNSRSGSPEMHMLNSCSCSCKQIAVDCLLATKSPRGCAVDLSFLKALATNPLIIASVVALMVNLIHGPELPKLVTRVSSTIAASFAAPALFIVGLSMYGKFELLLRNPTDLLLATILVLTKVLLLPNLMRTLALIILPAYTPAAEIAYLIDFSFLYGLLPTAPTACIIAKQYGILPNVVSISMLLSTFASAPLMLAAALIINPSTVIKVSKVESVITQTMKISSIITLSLASLTLYALWKSSKQLRYSSLLNSPSSICRRTLSELKKATNPMYIFLLLLIVSQILIGVGGLVWYFVDTSSSDPIMPVHGLQPGMLGLSTSNVINEAEHHPTISLEDRNMTLLVGHTELVTVAVPFPVVEPEPLLAPSLPEPEMLIRQEAPETNTTTPAHVEFCFECLRRIQYVLSSSGILIARLAILCLVVTLAANRFKSDRVASRISSVMTKSSLIVSLCIVVGLIFDSNQLLHLAVEPSIPSRRISLYARLVYNIIFLIIVVPLFAMIVRSDNKQTQLMLKREDNFEATDNEAGRAAFVKRRFVTSTASLSSDTSSALTTNTNVESTSNNSQLGAPPTTSEIINGRTVQPSSCDPLVIMDCRTLDQIRRPIGSNLTPINSSSQENSPIICSYNGIIDQQRPTCATGNLDNQQIRNPSYDVDESTSESNNLGESQDEGIQSNGAINRRTLHRSELIKFSIMIVFMLIIVALNLTSVSQKLIQEQPVGTFRQVEVMSVALEFGQGLLTFLVYGMKVLLNRTIIEVT